MKLSSKEITFTIALSRWLKSRGLKAWSIPRTLSLFIREFKYRLPKSYRKRLKILSDLYQQKGDLMFRRNALTSFYETPEWKKLRAEVIEYYGTSCMRCGADFSYNCVDHIKPISEFPELKLSFENLQVLCKPCNKEKSNLRYTDYRDYLNVPLEIRKYYY